MKQGGAKNCSPLLFYGVWIMSDLLILMYIISIGKVLFDGVKSKDSEKMKSWILSTNGF